MGIFLGSTNISKAFGNNLEISKAYQGSNELYSEGGSGPSLRNILITDNLQYKTLYFNFPSGFFNDLPLGYSVIFMNSEIGLGFFCEQEGSTIRIYGYDIVGSEDGIMYAGDVMNGDLINLPSCVLGEYWGAIDYLDTSHPAYPYIKIEA